MDYISALNALKELDTQVTYSQDCDFGTLRSFVEIEYDEYRKTNKKIRVGIL